MASHRKPHIALFPSPGMGHLIPFTQLASLLSLRHSLSVTLFTTSTLPSSLLSSLPASVTSIVLPSSPSALDSSSGIELRILSSISPALPSLRRHLFSLKSTNGLLAFVADPFASQSLAIARDLGIRSFIFFEANMTSLSLMLYLPILDRTLTGEFRDLAEPVRLPGCVPIAGKDLVDPVQDRNSELYRSIVRLSEQSMEAEGILVNSFVDMEPGPAAALRDRSSGHPPVYPVGPLIKLGLEEGEDDELECLKWLDEQPRGSVVLVSFGSGGTLPMAQTMELALGLELSKQRFLWVVRTPDDEERNSAFFDGGGGRNPFAFLPERFLERTKGVGMVVANWAPQVRVLAHEATGGFVTHCGWNSVLESVVHGVPMVAWPLYAEQKMNAVMMVEEAGVALRPKEDEDGMTGREEIARVVKELMEGEEGKSVRRRVEELQAAAAKALTEQGSSSLALSELVSKWKA